MKRSGTRNTRGNESVNAQIKVKIEEMKRVATGGCERIVNVLNAKVAKKIREIDKMASNDKRSLINAVEIHNQKDCEESGNKRSEQRR